MLLPSRLAVVLLTVLSLPGCAVGSSPVPPETDPAQDTLDPARLSEDFWTVPAEKSALSSVSAAKGFLVRDRLVVPTSDDALVGYSLSDGSRRNRADLGFRIGHLLRMGDVAVLSSRNPDAPVRMAGVRLPSLEILWSRTLSSESGATLARLDEKTLLAAAADGIVHQVDAGTGEVLFRKRIDPRSLGGVVSDGTRVALTSLDKVRLYSLPDWELRWEAPTRRLVKPISIGGGRLVVASYARTGGGTDALWSYALADGAFKTVFELAEGEMLSSEVLETDGFFYLAGSATIYCLRQESGEVVWKRRIPYRRGDLSLSGTVLITAWGGGLSFLDAGSGNIRNERPGLAHPSYGVAGPKGVVIVGDGGELKGIPAK